MTTYGNVYAYIVKEAGCLYLPSQPVYSLKVASHVLAPVLQLGTNHCDNDTGSVNNSFVEGSGHGFRQNRWIFGLVRRCLFHLQYEVAIADISICGHESSTRISEAMITQVPSVHVQGIKVVTEAQNELVSTFNIIVGLNVVVPSVKWHFAVVETLGSSLSQRRPERHKEMLLLIQVLDSRTSFCQISSDFVIINSKGDIIGRPVDLICVPLISRIKVLDRHPFVGEARVDQICIDFMLLRRNYLKIDVVPAFNRKFLFIKVLDR